MLTLDTSGLVALISSADRHHRAAVDAFQRDNGPYIIPLAIMAEIAYIIEQRIGSALMLTLLEDVQSGAYQLDAEAGDLPRIAQLVRRYADLRLGFADSAVVACAERRGGRVLTTDHRHFSVVARGERTITVLPGQ